MRVLTEAVGVALVLAVALWRSTRERPEEYDWEGFRSSQRRAWLLPAGVLAWVIVVEDAGLASLNHPPVVGFVWSATLAFAAIGVTGIAIGLVMRRAEHSIGPAMRALLELPKSRAFVFIVSTGVAEELVFRGFVLTRVAALTGSEVAAVAVSVVGFAASRTAGLERAQIAQVVVLGAVIAAAFAYTGNLLAVIVARAGYDALTTLSADPADFPNE
ncbi:CPBP family intramembrane metalloprotease [Halobacterium salinarum]|uniref:CPBP family intramembrane glutamic endopeptidase n=1 Tax=Halobacterium salinarum TaxID=2242 RepID=UPI002553F864|nr:CPBP family intramembrane glutamic endopeptidase [Halobacterium salinarum]MDL0140034.1 CPBP family intramembrane metalloprotease [Halobacterium salinarum]